MGCCSTLTSLCLSIFGHFVDESYWIQARFWLSELDRPLMIKLTQRDRIGHWQVVYRGELSLVTSVYFFSDHQGRSQIHFSTDKSLLPCSLYTSTKACYFQVFIEHSNIHRGLRPVLDRRVYRYISFNPGVSHDVQILF